MDEVLPGVFHWTAFHEGIGSDVHSHFAAASGTLFDPMAPTEVMGFAAGDASFATR
jgi:hypothetical protein